MKIYTLAELEAMPTITVGQTDDLKIEQGTDENPERVWLSRMTIEDGMAYNNMVTVERFNGSIWEEVEHYEAK